jgi:hypothetical protein
MEADVRVIPPVKATPSGDFDMRPTLFIALAAAALAAGQGFAQEGYSTHHPADTKAAPAASSMEGMDPAAMHEMCKSVMGKDMAAKPVHEHSREKGGMAMGPNGKPLTKAEMAKMHERCAAMMEHDTKAAPPAPK